MCALGGSVWLKQWSEANDLAHGNPHVVRYLLIYLAFGIGSALLVVVQTLILWIFCSIEVSLTPGDQLITRTSACIPYCRMQLTCGPN